jgi:hypothetical protein
MPCVFVPQANKVFGSLFSKSEWEFEGNALISFLQAGF